MIRSTVPDSWSGDVRADGRDAGGMPGVSIAWIWTAAGRVASAGSRIFRGSRSHKAVDHHSATPRRSRYPAGLQDRAAWFRRGEPKAPPREPAVAAAVSSIGSAQQGDAVTNMPSLSHDREPLRGGSRARNCPALRRTRHLGAARAVPQETGADSARARRAAHRRRPVVGLPPPGQVAEDRQD